MATMPPVAPLQLAKTADITFGTPLSSARSRPGTSGSLGMSARHILKPDVGKQAMLSALGDISPFWADGSLGSARGGAGESSRAPQVLADALPAKSSTKPYHVGRMRARGQLFQALDTKNEQAQLRRLEQALDTPAARYDPDLKQIGAFAGRQADTLSNRLRTPMPYADYSQPAAPAAEPSAQSGVEKEIISDAPADAEDPADPNMDAAALRIQSRYRGGKDRQAVEEKKQQKKQEAEELAAATKIQSMHRGNTARKKTRGMAEEQAGE